MGWGEMEEKLMISFMDWAIGNAFTLNYVGFGVMSC